MTKCEFTIERYKDKSGKLIAFTTLPDDIDNYEYKTFKLSVEGNYSYVPARINCRVDDSHPDESDCEIVSAIDQFGKDWVNDLTDDEMESVIELIVDNSEEDDYYDDEPYEYDCD